MGLYLDQALFACRVRTSRIAKTSPFYLVYGQQPKLVGDPMRALPNDARLQLVQSARAQGAIAAYEEAVRSKTTRDTIVKPHELEMGEWVLVRHENPKKLSPSGLDRTRSLRKCSWGRTVCRILVARS